MMNSYSCQVLLGLLPLLFVYEHINLSVLVWCALSTGFSLICISLPSWPHQRPCGMFRLIAGFVLPTLAHSSLLQYHGGLRLGWLEEIQRVGALSEPPAAFAHAHQVVALIVGIVWALPVYQFVSETTQGWSLPSHG